VLFMRHGGQGSTFGLPSPPVLGDSNREGWEPSQAIAIGAAALRPTFKGKLFFPTLSVYLSSFRDATGTATCAVHWCTLPQLQLPHQFELAHPHAVGISTHLPALHHVSGSPDSLG
jgi:hypothetical protein